MKDLRFSILSSFINRKLGLVKRQGKLDNVVNGILHDIKKSIPKEQLENSTLMANLFNERTIND